MWGNNLVLHIVPIPLGYLYVLKKQNKKIWKILLHTVDPYNSLTAATHLLMRERVPNTFCHHHEEAENLETWKVVCDPCLKCLESLQEMLRGLTCWNDVTES